MADATINPEATDGDSDHGDSWDANTVFGGAFGEINYGFLRPDPHIFTENDPSWHRSDAARGGHGFNGHLDTTIIKYTGAGVDFNDPRQVRGFIEKVSTDMGIPPQLMMGLVQQESGYCQWQNGHLHTSPAGAMGFTQLMPGTAAAMGVDARDPAQNIIGGAYYLKQMLARYHGDQAKALAAYNAGPGRVPVDGALDIAALPNETQDYIQRVSGYADQFSHGQVLASSQATDGHPDASAPAAASREGGLWQTVEKLRRLASVAALRAETIVTPGGADAKPIPSVSFIEHGTVAAISTASGAARPPNHDAVATGPLLPTHTAV